MLFTQIGALLFCIVVGSLGLHRALRLRTWLRLKGTVLGANQGGADSSGVRISFVDPSGLSQNFTSGIQFGHSYWASSTKRIPYAQGDAVDILVNPKDYKQAELFSKNLFWVPVMLLVASVYLSYRVIITN